MANATDIITYIGIPLAVLGVLPILYTAINSLITIRKIKQSLRHNGLFEATTRSSLMSGVVEVTLPRFSITPLDREENTEYWKPNGRPSTLKGGTWTIFNWNVLITGSRLYRLQYSDDLQIPQAEIHLEELLAFLLDRGAVPDVKGLHMLRVSGLWTPTGTGLLLSPDTLVKVLKVSVPNDSDGVLSLTLYWNSAWDQRDPSQLSPGWIRLQIPLDPEETYDDALEQQPAHPKPTSIRFRLSHVGSSVSISHALWEQENKPLASSPSLDHLRSGPASNWAPPIALALGLSKSFPLYNHHLDDFLTTLATRDTIPCGVLVTLGLLDESEAPSWETKYVSNGNGYNYLSSMRAESRARDAEMSMSPKLAEIAWRKRKTEEREQFVERSRMNNEQAKERSSKRQREAVGSSRLDAVNVTNTALKWLRTTKLVDKDASVQSVVETLLVDLIRQKEHAMSVCTVLKRWREWTDRGGMTIDDLEFLKKNKVSFCNAACIMGLFREVFTKEESTVALDMRECVQHWKKVRLG
ncbi:MAG: hypothetical protein ASARMPREDX12_009047 [Alectoria sarmentosa]|nr:MAG: hypothetical protein ASARMPREDX12_009047 [Alectoria sarmentosa]